MYTHKKEFNQKIAPSKALIELKTWLCLSHSTERIKKVNQKTNIWDELSLISFHMDSPSVALISTSGSSWRVMAIATTASVKLIKRSNDRRWTGEIGMRTPSIRNWSKDSYGRSLFAMSSALSWRMGWSFDWIRWSTYLYLMEFYPSFVLRNHSFLNDMAIDGSSIRLGWLEIFDDKSKQKGRKALLWCKFCDQVDQTATAAFGSSAPLA